MSAGINCVYRKLLYYHIDLVRLTSESDKIAFNVAIMFLSKTSKSASIKGKINVSLYR